MKSSEQAGEDNTVLHDHRPTSSNGQDTGRLHGRLSKYNSPCMHHRFQRFVNGNAWDWMTILAEPQVHIQGITITTIHAPL